jgi:hypothetical protein
MSDLKRGQLLVLLPQGRASTQAANGHLKRLRASGRLTGEAS